MASNGGTTFIPSFIQTGQFVLQLFGSHASSFSKLDTGKQCQHRSGPTQNDIMITILVYFYELFLNTPITHI